MSGLSPTTIALAALLPLGLVGFWLGAVRSKRLAARARIERLPSRPAYYGNYVAILTVIPPLLIIVVWGIFEPRAIQHLVLSTLSAEHESARPARDPGLLLAEISNIAEGRFEHSAQDPQIIAGVERYREISSKSSLIFSLTFALAAVLGSGFALTSLSATFHPRKSLEASCRTLLFLSSALTIAITIGIVASLIVESVRFFAFVSPFEFVFGTHWNPQMALRADQVASAGSFGALSLIIGTGFISLIALLVAGPIGLFSAIYLSQYATPRLREVAKPLLEVLAGIPTVVYGFFAALTVAPFIRDSAKLLGLSATSESALAAGLVMGIMIIPFISSLSDDMLHAVPSALKEGSLALGATQSETIIRVLLPTALPGIVGAFLLAISRAIGETMIVVMAAGLTAHLTLNPLQSVTTITVQIVNTLVGDQEFDSPKTLSAFALGALLFLTTLILNVLAQRIVKRYREQHE